MGDRGLYGGDWVIYFAYITFTLYIMSQKFASQTFFEIKFFNNQEIL